MLQNHRNRQKKTSTTLSVTRVRCTVRVRRFSSCGRPRSLADRTDSKKLAFLRTAGRKAHARTVCSRRGGRPSRAHTDLIDEQREDAVREDRRRSAFPRERGGGCHFRGRSAEVHAHVDRIVNVAGRTWSFIYRATSNTACRLRTIERERYAPHNTRTRGATSFFSLFVLFVFFYYYSRDRCFFVAVRRRRRRLLSRARATTRIKRGIISTVDRFHCTHRQSYRGRWNGPSFERKPTTLTLAGASRGVWLALQRPDVRNKTGRWPKTSSSVGFGFFF